MSNKIYDSLKWTALVLLPMIAALYFGLGNIWGFPAIEEVMGSIVVIDTALGIFINKSAKSNIVGSMIVRQDAEGVPQGMRLEADKDLLIFKDQSQVAFRVKRELDV